MRVTIRYLKIIVLNFGEFFRDLILGTVKFFYYFLLNLLLFKLLSLLLKTIFNLLYLLMIERGREGNLFKSRIKVQTFLIETEDDINKILSTNLKKTYLLYERV